MKKFFRKIKRLADKILGTKADELFWRFRHFFDRSWVERYISEASISHPHRKLLIDKIAVYSPLSSVLEIGCSSGPNLYLLAKSFPKISLYGIDISTKAIKAGQAFFKQKEMNNVSLILGKFDGIKEFQDKSFDIVFSDAALIYAGPDKIDVIIREMLRIAKKAVVLCEQHTESKPALYRDRWIHNYKLLFQRFVPLEKIKFTKFSSGLWVGDWEKFGHIIEVDLR